jgi:hypothetical protein
MDRQQLLDEGSSGGKTLFDLLTALSPGLLNLLQADGLPSQLHCLTRNLTWRSSRTTPSGIIVAFSTLPPLHQFSLVEKTGSLYSGVQKY